MRSLKPSLSIGVFICVTERLKFHIGDDISLLLLRQILSCRRFLRRGSIYLITSLIEPIASSSCLVPQIRLLLQSLVRYLHFPPILLLGLRIVNFGNLHFAQLMKESKLSKDFNKKIKVVDFAPLIESLSKRRLPDEAHEVFIRMKSDNFLPNYRTLSALMLCFAENGSVLRARTIWEEVLNSSFVPDLFLISKLMSAYEQIGCFSEVARITKDISERHPKLSPVVCSLAIRCFGKNGQLQLMEDTIDELDSKQISLDSATANAIIRYYTSFGTLEKMEQAYGRLKKSGIVIEEEETRAVLLAYLKQRKFYRLREFLSDVGLGRSNLGNILWNSVLLSFAADFKMKSLQREFIAMLGAGFTPDLTTFNIRALAFSRMALFWDMHLTLEHMRRLNIVPDLVTFGCVVDAYMDRRLAKNLEFVYKRMNLDDYPVVLTDPLVFEVLGKGDFHLSSEAVLEFGQGNNWTYRKLIGVYLKKKLRRDQIFWNY